jgi:hypothetical protein
MTRAFAAAGLAAGLSIATMVSAHAQAVHSFSQSTQTTYGAPQVMDSWMQPTVVRSVQSTDQDGNPQTRQEPLIMERHERVMLPREERNSVTEVTKETTPVVRTSSTTESKRYVAARPIHRYHRRAAKSLAMNTVRSRAAATTSSVSSTEQIDHNERVEQKADVFERRDPALDLY